MPKISIITPVYNGRDFIEDCILSVKGVQGVSFEHIIIDDGSSDETRDIIKRYTHVKLLCQGNRGATAARNYGLTHAKGDYIKFLDADDVLESSSVKRQYEFSQKLRGREISYGYRELIGEKGESLGFRKRPSELVSDSDMVNLILRNIQTSLPLYPSFALDQVGGFDESIGGRQEWNLNLRLHLKGWSFTFLDSLIIQQRLHGGEHRISNRRLIAEKERKLLDNTYFEIKELMGNQEADAWASYVWNVGREFLRSGQRKEASEFFRLAKLVSARPTRFLSSKYRVFERVFGPYASEKLLGFVRSHSGL